MQILLDFRAKPNYAPVIDLVNELSKKFAVYFIPNIKTRTRPPNLAHDVVYIRNVADLYRIKPDVVFSLYSNLLLCGYLKLKLRAPLVNYMFIYTAFRELFSSKFLAFPISYKISEVLKLTTYLLPKSLFSPDTLLVPNSVVSDELVRFGFDKDRVLVLPWGINIKRYETYFSNKFEAEKENILVYAGPLHPLRFPISLLYLLYDVKKEHSSVHFFFLFRSDLWHQATFKKLKDLVKKLNLEKNVTIKIGLSHEEYLRHVSNGDVVILPYLSSGLVEAPPFTLLECMVLAKPVITNRGIATEGIIKNGINGFFMPENLSLTNLVMSLITDKEKCRHVGQKAREFVCRNYNLIDFSNKLAYLFENFCGN